MIRFDDRASEQSDRCVRFGLGDIRVAVSSALDEVLDDMVTLYGGYPTGGGVPEGTIRMEVRRQRRSRLRPARYLILGDGEEIGHERQREEIVPFLEWGINWRVINTRPDFLQLHAAALAYHGQGVVLAGSSGCGKSTLVAGLLTRRWQYLSDEFALIDPNTLLLHPFPKALCLKSGAFDVAGRLGLRLAGRRYYVKGLKGRVAYVNPQDLGPETIAGSVPIRYVIFPKHVKGRPARLCPISRAKGSFALAGSALNRKVFGHRAISILSDIVRGAECFGLESGPIDDTCDLIESLVQR